jgi:predicted HicB family RNase H-like nuclease
MKTDTQIGMRVTSEFKERLEKQAAAEQRSVSNLIVKVLTEYLDGQDSPEN